MCQWGPTQETPSGACLRAMLAPLPALQRDTPAPHTLESLVVVLSQKERVDIYGPCISKRVCRALSEGIRWVQIQLVGFLMPWDVEP